MTFRRSSWWWVSACFLGSIVLGGLTYLWWHSGGYWLRLREAARQFEPPAGFVEFERHEVGTTLCLWTCDGARIEVYYRYPQHLDPEGACRELQRAVERQYGPTELPIGLRESCAYAPLERVDSGAYLQVPAGCLGTVMIEGACKRVEFNSGID